MLARNAKVTTKSAKTVRPAAKIAKPKRTESFVEIDGRSV
jgi:hypothetical protein